jgi:peptide/nickel transport system substrate-binding protein/oligopeptide transport system substrate-binding protein
MSRQAWWRLALVVLLVAGCDPEPGPVNPTPSPTSVTAAPTAAQEQGGTLRWAVQEPTGIVPSVAVDDTGLLVVDTLFDSLTDVDADGEVMPSAAVDWESFDNGQRWRFALRDGASYHDGTPVTAHDFVAAWSMTVEQGRTGAHLQDVAGYRELRDGQADTLAGLSAIDDLTLEVTLSSPNMELPAIVAHPSLGPIPPRAVEQATRFTERPVGNGPYQMVEPWAHGQFIRVARVEGWRNGPRRRSGDRVREIVFRFVDVNAAYVGFQQGRIDVAPIPAGALARARRAYGTARDGTGPGVVDAPEPSLYFLGMRVDTPPWDDPELRRALSRAIDRTAIVEASNDGQFDAAHGLVPLSLPGAGAEFCDTCLHLPSLAEAAFQRAGVTELTLSFDEGGGHDQIAQQISSDLQAIGVDVEVRSMMFEDYLGALEQGELALYRFGWQAQYPSAGAVLEPLLRSGAPDEAGDGANYGGYTSEDVDRLLDDARALESRDDREDVWAEVERIALSDQAVVPLFTFRQRTVISPRIENLTLTPWGTATPEQARIINDPEIAS